MLIPNHVDPSFAALLPPLLSLVQSPDALRLHPSMCPREGCTGTAWDWDSRLCPGHLALPPCLWAPLHVRGQAFVGLMSLLWWAWQDSLGFPHLTLCWSAPPHARRTQKVQPSTHTSAWWQHIQVDAGWSYPTLLLSQAYGDKTWQKITRRGHSTSPRQNFVFLDCIYFSDTPTDTSCKLG